MDRAREWVTKLDKFLTGNIRDQLGLADDEYSLEFRLIGIDATLGDLERRVGAPAEVGVLCIVTADTAAMAEEIGKMVNPHLLHYPLSENEPQATFAFPYSPAESSRGALYEFCLNHVLELDDPMAGFRIETVEHITLSCISCCCNLLLCRSWLSVFFFFFFFFFLLFFCLL